MYDDDITAGITARVRANPLGTNSLVSRNIPFVLCTSGNIRIDRWVLYCQQHSLQLAFDFISLFQADKISMAVVF